MVPGVLASGLLVRWMGVRRSATATLVLTMALALTGAATVDSWQGDRWFVTLFIAQNLVVTLAMVMLVAWAMRLSDPAVGASQFALFMAIANFGHSLSAGIVGWAVDQYGYSGTYLLTAAVSALAIALGWIAGCDRTVWENEAP